MKISTYPTDAWYLMQSFKPAQVKLIGRAFSSGWAEWHKTSTGTHHHEEKLFQSKSEAVAFGREQISKLEADLAKRRVSLDKRIAALDKASA